MHNVCPPALRWTVLKTPGGGPSASWASTVPPRPRRPVLSTCGLPRYFDACCSGELPAVTPAAVDGTTPSLPGGLTGNSNSCFEFDFCGVLLGASQVHPAGQCLRYFRGASSSPEIISTTIFAQFLPDIDIKEAPGLGQCLFEGITCVPAPALPAGVSLPPACRVFNSPQHPAAMGLPSGQRCDRSSRRRGGTGVCDNSGW